MSAKKRLLVLAAMAGIVGGGLAGCASYDKGDNAASEKNSCSGKNGCSGDKSSCSGDKNSCKEGSSCGKNSCG